MKDIKINKRNLALLLSAMLVMLIIPAMASANSWEQFHANVQHTGYSTSMAPDTNSTAWISDNIGAQPGSSLVVANGLIYVNCGNENVTALNMYTGAYVEMAQGGPGDNNLGSWSSPCYYNGNVYRARTDACNGGPTAADGYIFQSYWNISADESACTTGTYYCYNENGYTHGENTSDELWNFSVTGHAQGTPAYYDGLVYLTSWWGDYLGSGNGYIYCVYANNGTEKWNLPLSTSACGSPSLDVSRNTVYVSTYHFGDYGKLYALNMNNGTEKWNATVQRTDSTPAIDADGNIYLCGGCEGYSDKQAYCFYPDGIEKWNTSTSLDIGDWTCSVAVADGKVFVGKSADASGGQGMNIGCDGTYALNASTGDVIWSYPDGGSSPIIAEGMVFTIGNDGKVYAFGDKTYDFSVGAGTDHFAYEGLVTSRPASSNDILADNISTVTNIQADDDSVQNDYATSGYAAQQFNFGIEETSPSKISVSWIGKGYHDAGGSYNGAYLYVWNGSAYEELDNNDGIGTYDTLTGEITSDIGDYISSGTVSVMVVQKSSFIAGRPPKYSRIETDYVKLEVTL